MSLHVSLQVPALGEAGFIDGAFVRLSSRVDAYVDGKCRLLKECLLTSVNCAFKWFFEKMSACMVDQRFFLYKGFSAFGALVGTVLSMDPLMHSKGAELRKRLCTVGALVRLESLVNDLVLPQGTGNGEGAPG